MKEMIITEKEAGQRADKYVRKYLSDAPLSFIYRTFRKKDVKINGHWIAIDYILQVGDQLRIYVSEEQIAQYAKPRPIVPVDLSYPIIYEDHEVLIVNKPAGLLVHGDEHEKRNTLANQILNYLYQKGEYDPHIDVGFTPAPVHRLDRNTSGVLVFGKTLPAQQVLLELFKKKDQLTKKYLALVVGHPPKSGSITAALIKDEATGLVRIGQKEEGAKSAWSDYVVMESFGKYSLVEVTLHTGRTHQIRVHLASIGHPIVGDGKYGSFLANRAFKNQYGFDRQFLHARSITFGEVPSPLSALSHQTYYGELPNDMLQLLAKMRSEKKQG